MIKELRNCLAGQHTHQSMAAPPCLGISPEISNRTVDSYSTASHTSPDSESINQPCRGKPEFGSVSSPSVVAECAATILDGNTEDFMRLWHVPQNSTYSESPLMDDRGIMYNKSEDRQVCAVKDGKVLWRYDSDRWIFPMATGKDGILYLSRLENTGSESHSLLAVRGGTLLWECPNMGKIGSWGAYGDCSGL